MKRKIISIDENKCTGCGFCVPDCPEGALQIIDGKARLVSDLFCDGLGACLGTCPEGAITIEERDAEPYNERRVMENIILQGESVIKAHLAHLKDHGQQEYYHEARACLREKGISIPGETGYDKSKHVSPHSSDDGCPGARVMTIENKAERVNACNMSSVSRLGQWPVQLMLVPPAAPYFQGTDLLITADCVPFAYAGFHEDLLKGKIVLVGCPKLDDSDLYREKLTEIVTSNEIRSLTVAHMEVPCCFGLVQLVRDAVNVSGKSVPFEDVVIGINGGRQ